MKILVFCQYYYPETVGPTLFCEELVKKGNDVTVVTGLPNYPSGIIDKKYKFFKNRKEIINGVRVKRVFEFGRKKGKLHLALNYLSYMLSSTFKSLFLGNKFDIVYCYQLSPVTMALPAIVYSRIYKKKSLLYCLDLWPESLKVVGIKEENIIFKLLDRFSKKMYNSFDRVLVSSDGFKKYLNQKHKIDLSKIKYIPQFSVDYLENNLDSDRNITLNNTQCINFVFAGNCGFAQNLERLLKAIKNLKYESGINKSFKLHIAGDGANLENLKRLVTEYNIEDEVKFYGFLQKDKLMELYNVADATLVTLTNENSVGSTLPLKLISYMSLGKPIFASLSGEVAELLKREKIAVVVDEHESSLEDKMKDFINNKPKYSLYGKNARNYYEENFRIDTFLKKMLNEFELILGGKENV